MTRPPNARGQGRKPVPPAQQADAECIAALNIYYGRAASVKDYSPELIERMRDVLKVSAATARAAGK